MTTRNFLKLLTFILIFFLIASESKALSEKEFFSYKRFSLNQDVVGKLSEDGKIQKDISSFVSDFSKGLLSFSKGEYIRSKEFFINARKSWPEYFNTDFCIALLCEKEKRYEEAAQYYKSYLEKLKSFYDGKYGISGALILSFTSGNIEDYKSAYTRVKTRLAEHGVNIDKTKSPFKFTVFLIISVILGVAFLFYIFTTVCILPHIKKRYRIKNVPEGFWICPKCITANSDLVKECAKCGKPKNADKNAKTNK